MPQVPVKSSLFVSQMKPGAGFKVTPSGGTGIVTGEADGGGSGKFPSNTAITTVGAGTLTAAALVGQQITRSGPVAAFTDTTDTAVAIVAAIPNAEATQAFYVTIQNTTAFADTLAAGVGVTLSGFPIIPANSSALALLSLTSLIAVTIQVVAIIPNVLAPSPINTAISTVGAGTLTGAAIAGGVITRTGSVAAYSDATDTAVAIVAAIPDAAVSQSFYLTVVNSVAFAETITAGVGVTLSGFTVIPANSTGRFLVTIVSLTTVTIQGVSVTSNTPVPNAKYVTQNLTAGVVAAANMAGAAICYLENTNATPGNQTTPTATALFAAIPGAQIGFSYTVRVINKGAGTWTWVADASVTAAGTLTVAQNITRDYIVTFTSGVAATMQSVGAGVSP